jgi:pilus assembly protein Flp/PilA
MLPLYELAKAKAFAIIHEIQDDESGATAIEYGLIAAGIAVAIIGVVFTLGDQISAFFANIQEQLAAKNPGG